MSFLYKALLKSNADNNSSQTTAAPSRDDQSAPESSFNQAQAGQNRYQPNQVDMPMFAQPQSNENGSTMWLVVALLLLVIGVLAGYILGQNHQPTATNNNSPVATLPANLEQGSAAEVVADVQTVDAAVISEPPIEANKPSAMPTNSTQNTANVSDNPAAESKLSDEPKQPAQRVTQQANGEATSTSTIAEPIDAEQTVNEVDDIAANTEASAPQEYVVSGDAVVPIEQVSEQLRSQFALAVEATESLDDQPVSEPNVTSESSLVTIHELSAAERAGIPPLYYGTHMYATDRNERYVKINNQMLKEGDELMPGLKLLEIRLDIIVWETRYQRFAQEALDDFEG